MTSSLQDADAHCDWGLNDKRISRLALAPYLALDQNDQACTLLAHVAGFEAFPERLTVGELRKYLRQGLAMDKGLTAAPPKVFSQIAQLKALPGGWQHLDGLWEFLWGMSLTHACDRDVAVEPILGPETTQGTFRYSLKAVHYEYIDVEDDDGNDLFMISEFQNFKMSNDLPGLLRAIPEILKECDNLPGKSTRDNGFWHRFEIYDKGKKLLYVPFKYDGEPDGWDEHEIPIYLRHPMERYEFKASSLRVITPDRELFQALEKVYGGHIAELLSEGVLQSDLGL
jgi:hypothetical protein